MFKKDQQIDNVKAFQAGEYLCYLHTGKGIVCSNGFEYSANTKGSLYLLQNKLFRQSYRGELQVFDVEQKECIFENDKNEFQLFIDPRTSLENGIAIYATQKIDKNEEYGLFDFKSKSFQRKGKGISTAIPELQLGLNWGGTLSSVNAISLNSGEILWSFEDFGKYNNASGDQFSDGVKNLLGVYGSRLWFGLLSGKILGLNIKTGALEHQVGFKESDLTPFSYNIKEGDYLPFGDMMQLDKNKGEIIGLRDKYLMKVNLDQSNPAREYLNVGQSMATHKIISSYRNNDFPLNANFIYFCDDRQGKIGVFDRKRQEVVWSHELEIEKSGIAQILEMKYANNRWYVLDRNDTLHILERC
ncbi:hypothetical protein [Chryseolinea soli]|uniref:Uncharacterized protein n=1 Tax=Chryseolinea soli TaxID=2321403 RepID=A0A385SEQ3_9BACT|nr:hypothetical protein [Chryseolinea soli]AYB29382.1 hypothetical protein D4L85_01730 [Chryseolinea soli]